jgi:hypothetical protein
MNESGIETAAICRESAKIDGETVLPMAWEKKMTTAIPMALEIKFAKSR